MRAMVLAAGLGKRLRPLSIRWAKPALPVLGRPLIDYTMSLLMEAGIREVVVNVHHRPQSIEQSLGHWADDGLQIRYSHEPEILGTAGGLKQAQPWLEGETFVVVNADTLFDLRLSRVLQRHRELEAKATLLVRRRPPGTSYTPLSRDAKGRISAVGKETAQPLMFAGLWVLQPELFDRLSPGFGGLEDDLLPALVRERAAYGYLGRGAWFDIGTPRSYLRSSLEMVRQGTLRALWRDRPVRVGTGSQGACVAAGPALEVHPDAHFSGEVVLGAGCRVERDAKIQRSVLWDDVHVGVDALVQDSVITHGVSLPAGSRTVRQVVMSPGDDVGAFRSRELRNGMIMAAIKS